MKEVSKKCLSEIKNSRLKPIRRSYFLARAFFLWAIIFLLISAGSVSIGLVLNSLVANDWDIYSYLGTGFYQRVFHSLPYYWLGMSIISLLLVWLNFKRTGVGYHYRNRAVLASCLLISTILGFSLYQIGLSEHFEEQFVGYLPRGFMTKQRLIDDWMHPESGLLTGSVEAANRYSNLLILKDAGGNIWQVKLNDLNVNIAPQTKIKIIGFKENEGIFSAKEIRVW